MHIQEYGIEYTFKEGENIIEFTPDETGTVLYTCWMGMIKGSIVVTEDLDNAQGNAGDDASARNPSGEGAERMAQVISAGGCLVIPVSEVTETAVFYSVVVDGVEMEILAIRASDGTVRTAFNTCQMCYASGRGYYVQEGGALVCQNCGSRFTADQVERLSGGCNPWPIFAADKTETADSIQISYDYLKESSSIFANWRQPSRS